MAGQGTRKRKPGKGRLVILVVVLLLLAMGTFFASRWILSLKNPDKLEWFQEVIRSLGVGGWFVLLAIQYIQIVVAFIPGGPIQIISGALYGPWLGLAVCVAGTILATATVFYLVSRYGWRVISLFVDQQDISKYKFLNDNRRLEGLILLLFFIPGTPKDALTYLFALTPIKMSRFMVLSTLARMPAVLTSVFAGSSIIQGHWLRAGILFVAITLISLLGLLLHKKIIRFFSREHKGKRAGGKE